MSADENISTLRDQYEAYPYPPRDPAEEATTLRMTVLDQLAAINHFCFRGRGRFDGDFRALVAGGGTGDAAIYLAEQLREADAEVTYLDLSDASLAVARARAEARGLTNIAWVNGSLLDLADLGLGAFDYINCCGVLHHLEDPAAGLRALRGVLKPDGAVGVMVYGRYGRAGVYQMQEIMRMICAEEDAKQKKVDLTRAVLRDLPQCSPLHGFASRFTDLKTDIGTYDLLLHSRDRAYTVPELHALCDDCGLHLAGYAENRTFYSPETLITDPAVRRRLAKMSRVERETLAEIYCGAHAKHAFYATQAADAAADPRDLELAPVLRSTYDYGLGEKIRVLAADVKPGMSFNIRNGGEGSVEVEAGAYTAPLLRQMTGRIPLGRMFKKIARDKAYRAAPPGRDELLAEFLRIYALLHPIDMLLLKSPAQPDFKDTVQLQRRVSEARRAETANV